MAALNAIATSQVLARSYNDSGISTRWLQSWPSDVFILNSNFPKTVSAISTFPSEWQQEVVKIGSWTLFFLAVHVWAQTHFKQDAANFHIKTALSRGVAATLLTLFGLWGTICNFGLWKVGFVPTAGVTIDMFNLFTVYRLALGHFIADLLWLAYALVTHNISPRKDLIAHHVLCLAGFSFMMDSPGAVMGAVALTTEMMPMTSAIGAFGRAVSKTYLEDLANYLRLVVLSGWRIPVWCVLSGASALVCRALVHNQAAEVADEC
mmetsp:Transcript_13163/g.48001  ORF Transcript_13163/g.48001 Transcript_13163/m.48001 type:complete len:264 (-) Transcript_13163:354-1145(-)